MKFLMIFILLMPFTLLALEVDEKLTVRIMKSSESKKTIMLNRGTEDGLTEGDHAKFIVTAGIVARGVCIKVSPSRSVWSVYRVVNADFIVNDSVMTIKITPAVKITKDETQTLVQDDTPTKVSGDPTTLGIPLAEGAQDAADAKEENDSATDLKALETDNTPTTIIEKNIEVFTMVNFQALSSSAKTTSSGSYSGDQSSYSLGLYGEYYPKSEREWYSALSLFTGLSLGKHSNLSYNGSSSSTSITEFSLGTNWHPFKLPHTVNTFIPFFTLSGNLASLKSTLKSGSENTNTQTSSLSATGAGNGFSLGVGFKFYTHQGFGLRLIVDYYVRAEKYKQDNLGSSNTRSLAGPRVMCGLSYRF